MRLEELAWNECDVHDFESDDIINALIENNLIVKRLPLTFQIRLVSMQKSCGIFVVGEGMHQRTGIGRIKDND